jgi:DNA-binding NtrC family response regulator
MACSGARILIADDEPSLLRLMETYLDRLGYAVTTVCDPEEAWSALEAAPRRFDLAVLDATMAGAGLPDFVSKLLAASPELHILVTSGYPLDMCPVETGNRVVFLQKPFVPEVLAGAIRRMLATEEEDI